MKKTFSALLIGATLAMPINITVCSADGRNSEKSMGDLVELRASLDDCQTRFGALRSSCDASVKEVEFEMNVISLLGDLVLAGEHEDVTPFIEKLMSTLSAAAFKNENTKSDTEDFMSTPAALLGYEDAMANLGKCLVNLDMLRSNCDISLKRAELTRDLIAAITEARVLLKAAEANGMLNEEQPEISQPTEETV